MDAEDTPETIRCHYYYCDRPATHYAAWKTPTMSDPAFSYACDEHRGPGMIPLDEPVKTYLEHLAWPSPAARRPVDAL
jgi:hypothetical protein